MSRRARRARGRRPRSTPLVGPAIARRRHLLVAARARSCRQPRSARAGSRACSGWHCDSSHRSRECHSGLLRPAPERVEPVGVPPGPRPRDAGLVPSQITRELRWRSSNARQAPGVVHQPTIRWRRQHRQQRQLLVALRARRRVSTSSACACSRSCSSWHCSVITPTSGCHSRFYRPVRDPDLVSRSRRTQGCARPTPARRPRRGRVWWGRAEAARRSATNARACSGWSSSW